MVLEFEPGPLGQHVRGMVKLVLDISGNADVVDRTAPAADQMVVVTGQRLAQFEAGPLVRRHHAGHRTGALQHGQVAVDRRLGQARPGRQDLRD